jgi:ribosomal-protein-alanine N-acetyltransferase
MLDPGAIPKEAAVPDERLLTTRRLSLRPLAERDAEPLFDAFRDPETMRFMDSPPHSRVEETREHLNGMMLPGSCWWAIELLDRPGAIGFVGFLGGTRVPGMGYLLHRRYWRQGYGTEAVIGALEYGFAHLGLDRVELWINDANVASQRLAQAIGFSRRSQFRMRYPHEEAAHDKVVYGLFRYEWEARPAGPPVRPRACYGIQPILPVQSVATTVDFYCGTLGFAVDFLVDDPPTYGAVVWSDWSAEGSVIQFREEPGIDPGPKDVGLFVFVGPGIDALFERLRQAGVTVVDAPATRPWGMREFAVRDCNGYPLRFGTPV